jgi:ribokinase
METARHGHRNRHDLCPDEPWQLMSKPRILVVGSSNTDMVVKVPRIPRPGETVLSSGFSMSAGGKGANQAVAAARAGADVAFIARVGNDAFGKQAIASFRRDGIRTQFIFSDKRHPSGVALISVAASGQNSIAVAPGANGRLSPADLRHARSAFASADMLVVQLETPLGTVMAAVRLAVQYHVPVILNPAPARPLPKALLRNVTILTPNESEAELLTGTKVTNDTTAARAATKLHKLGVKTVIITLGARGAFVSERDGNSWRIPGLRVKVVDTTAAGDVFNGALAVALAEGRRLDEAVRFACAAAALSVGCEGAQASAPARRRIQEQYRKKS